MRKSVLVLFLLVCVGAYSQNPKVIYLTFNKTVHLFFSTEVKYKDVGTEDVLCKPMEKIVKLAPAVENFQETNLTVQTKDNRVYSFILKYKTDIDTLIYNIPESQGLLVKTNDVENEKIVVNDSILLEKEKKKEFENNCQLVLKKKQRIFDTDETEEEITVALMNVFVFNDKLYFSFKVVNNSNINYDVDYFYLTIQDKRKLKKSSIQPNNIENVFEFNKFDRLPAKEVKEIVIVTDKFTVPTKKKLYFEMKEQNGGRNFLFDIEESLIYKAPALIE